MRVRSRRILGLLFGLLACLPLSAHQMKVFATVEGNMIKGRVYLAHGAKASGATIIVSDADGSELVRLKPNSEGNFSYRVARRMDYRVVATSVDGHQASLTLRADEFSSNLPGVTTESPVSGEMNGAGAVQTATAAIPGRERPDLTEQIEHAVARQVRPMREALQAHEERVRLRDILGGIGYIVGLAGLALWWRGRPRDRDR